MFAPALDLVRAIHAGRRLGASRFRVILDGSYKYSAHAVVPQCGGRARGRWLPFGPYTDVLHSYMSFAKAFYERGHLAGVATADARTEAFRSVIGGEPKAGSRIYLLNPTGLLILSYGHLPPGAQVVDISAPIRFAHSRVHFASDRSPTYALNRRLFFSAVLVTAAIWGAAVLVGMLLLRSWRAKRKAIEMQIEQARLQDEITLRREVEAHLRQVAYVDTLTGLSNRPFVVDALNALVARRGSAPSILVFIDIDSFSLINDTLGHEPGDTLLVRVAAKLREAFPDDIVARFGGDDFVVLIRDVSSDASAYATRVKEIFERAIAIRGREMRITASQGIVVLDPEYERAEDVLRDAEIAMYASKKQGRGSFKIFSAGMRHQVELDAQLEHDLQHAIAVDEFTVYYQPVIDLRSGTIASLEALARWNRAGKFSQPGDFIPYAESHGLVSSIDALILRKVCAEMMRFISIVPGLSVAVNCSMAQLTSDDLVALTFSLLKRHNIPPSHLRLEITETSIMRNAEYALETLERLRTAGVLTVVDDFGTGYSSLAYLAASADQRHQDRPVIYHTARAKRASKGNRAEYHRVRGYARTLHRRRRNRKPRAVALFCQELGCTNGQGYLFAAPLPMNQMMDVMRRGYSAARFFIGGSLLRRSLTCERLHPSDPVIAEFAAYLRLERGQSPRTSEEYARDIELFAAFLEPGHPKDAPFFKLCDCDNLGRAALRDGTDGAAQVRCDVGAAKNCGAAIVFRTSKAGGPARR